MRLTLTCFGLALLLAGCSLAGDVTPEPGAPTLPPRVTAAPTSPPIVEPLLPEARPVALEGGLVYEEHCSACHGPEGNGGGSMTAQLPAPPPNFADPATLRERTPQELFLTVTQGRLENFMPPFADSLSVAERWNAVAYLYTLSASAEQVEAGHAVYTANCAGCHGEQGQGDGPEAAGLDTRPPDLSDHEYAAIRSAADYATVLGGDDPAHALAGTLGEADRLAVVDYARTLAYDYSAPADLMASGQGAVRGQVVNQTAGASAPGGLPIILYGFETETLVFTQTTTAQADGAFAFDGVAFAHGRQFVVTTEYQGVDYSSAPGSFLPTAGAEAALLELPLPVYETTTDRSALAVEQAHMFLEFTEPQRLTVGELFVFSNAGDRTLAAAPDSPLPFSLPAGATDLNVQGGQLGETYFETDAGFAVVLAVPPGESTTQLLYSYKLPYDGGVEFDQPLDYPVLNFNILVSDLNVTLAGPGLQNLGAQSFQGESFQNFSQAGLAAGDRLTFSVSGEPSAAAPVPEAVGGAPNPLTDTSNLAIGLGAVGLVLLGLGFYLFRRPGPAPARAREELIEAIAELDDDFEAQTVSEAEYRRERAQLKAELARHWGKKG